LGRQESRQEQRRELEKLWVQPELEEAAYLFYWALLLGFLR
jgi:hypothetical protein